MQNRGRRASRLSSAQFQKSKTLAVFKEKAEVGKCKRLRKANEQMKQHHDKVMSSLVKVE